MGDPIKIAWGIQRLGVPTLWRLGLSGNGVRVAHLDTGVSIKHLALNRAVAEFAEFDLDGKRVVADPAPYDSGEHGTHTAGTIAGRPVNGRYVGVAPGAELASAIVIEGGNVTARLQSAILWAIQVKAKVVNLSVGLRGSGDRLMPAVQHAQENGLLIVAAVGDEGPNSSRSPANYENVLSVGACDEEDLVPWFSSSQSFNRSRNAIVPTVIAPGLNITSTSPSGGYQVMPGSSMAAAHIAGLSALLWEAAPTASAQDIESAIVASSVLPKGVSLCHGNFGIPNAVLALKLLTGINCTD